jgi:5-formyltetrahydrofolate cyclo-ligase
MLAATAIPSHLKDHPAAGQPGYIAGYGATAGELPLHALQLQLRPDQIWCLPVVQSNGSLRFGPWRPGDALVNNRFGIPEPDLALDSLLDPQSLTVAFLPLLAFARDGQRLGMGAGYYDRSFAFRQQTPAPPWLIGVGYSFQEFGGADPAPWDVPMDAVVTEHELIVCEPKRGTA